jgi:DNA-3-methyladenine glycosylase II
MAKDDGRSERILSRVKRIPRGRVRTYGDIDPDAPRLVGRVLATVHDGSPWHRVVRADGSLPMGDRQRRLLLEERVPMKGDRVDLSVARRPSTRISFAAAIDDVADRDPVLANLVALVGPITQRPRDPDGHFGALVRSIVFQQLAGAAARAIHQRVRAVVDGEVTPEALTRASDEALRGAGLSAAKLASLRDLSAKVLDGSVVLDASSKRSDDDIAAGLVTVRGVGRWTAEMYLMFELRRLDVWPVDDLGVRQGYGLAWGLDAPPSPKELDPLGDRFRPYRSVVARYCWEAVALFRGGTDPSLR